MAQRALNQRICVRTSHVVEVVSTLPSMTGVDWLRLQVSWLKADKN